MRDFLPDFGTFVNEGALTNYRKEKDSQKIHGEQMVGTFDEVVHNLIKERIPFYFDCEFNGYARIGYLMHESLNGQSFGGYILDSNKSEEVLCKEFTEKICKMITVEKPGKLCIGRTDFADLQKANDLDTIIVVVKAFKKFSKDKGLTSREITGNKYEARVNIDFLCDTNNRNNIIEYVF
jgi:hypothetical protein